jgi:hypothetical protein
MYWAGPWSIELGWSARNPGRCPRSPGLGPAPRGREQSLLASCPGLGVDQALHDSANRVRGARPACVSHGPRGKEHRCPGGGEAQGGSRGGRWERQDVRTGRLGQEEREESTGREHLRDCEVDWGKLVMGDFGPCGLMWVGGEEVELGW